MIGADHFAASLLGLYLFRSPTFFTLTPYFSTLTQSQLSTCHFLLIDLIQGTVLLEGFFKLRPQDRIRIGGSHTFIGIGSPHRRRRADVVGSPRDLMAYYVVSLGDLGKRIRIFNP
jgi:hypothetical protein